MQPTQLVQSIECGCDSHLPRYFPFPLLARLWPLPWCFILWCKELSMVLSRCVCSSGSLDDGPVSLLSSDLFFLSLAWFWVVLMSLFLDLSPHVKLGLTREWVFNHFWIRHMDFKMSLDYPFQQNPHTKVFSIFKIFFWLKSIIKIF